MSRRGNGDGSWRKRANGSYEYRLCVDGEDLSASGKTKAAARARMDEKLARLRVGQPSTDSRMTVGQLLEQWKGAPLNARTTRRGPMKESTKAGYRTLIELYLVGRHDEQHPERDIAADPIASVRLDKLKPIHVEGLVARLRDKRLSESTSRAVYHVLRLALSHAVDNELLARNPADKVARPVAEQKEARHLSPNELRALLAASASYRYSEALALIAGTGMRRGEALALKWDNVDLVRGIVSIEGTLARIDGHLVVTATKTKRSQRTVHLTPGLVDRLARLKDSQEEEARALDGAMVCVGGKERPAWTNTGFVFTTETGQPVDPRNVYRTLQLAARKAKLSNVGVHTLRHSWASAALDAGEQIANVSEQLGHSDVRITQIYTHTNDPSKRETAVRTAAIFGL